jgi:hypothetical protein
MSQEICENTDATAHQLQNSLTFISETIRTQIPAISCNLDHPPPIRANVKWSRILLNKVPTEKTDTRPAYSPDECHKALIAENPSYASLTVTQRPSWVRNPLSYTANTMSSLTFAFEDPDSTRAATLLADKVLYISGATATAKRWKQRPPTKMPPQHALRAAAPFPLAEQQALHNSPVPPNIPTRKTGNAEAQERVQVQAPQRPQQAPVTRSGAKGKRP